MAERSPKRVFISYSRRDRDWLDRLVAHLAPLQHDRLIDPWIDIGKLDYGDRYNEEIGRAIDSSGAAVLLVSPHFQSSSFIREMELPRVLRHAETGQLKLYWILVSDCLLADRLGGIYQCANDTNGALDGLPPAEVNRVLARLSRDLQRHAGEGPAMPPVHPRGGGREPFVNSLAMPFSLVPGTGLLFSQWLTRVQDYALFAAECPVAGAKWRRATFKRVRQGRDHPVVWVNWQEASAFCAWLTQREGIRYRLPSDEEWTLAAGGAAGEGAFPWGTQWPPPAGAGNYAGEEAKGMGILRIGGYRDGHPFTSPVGSYAPNQFGIYDLGGNVWEWCANLGESVNRRVVRGGSWRTSHPEELVNLKRAARDPARGFDDTGFRCVAELSA